MGRGVGDAIAHGSAGLKRVIVVASTKRSTKLQSG
jgi:hypothetical protein